MSEPFDFDDQLRAVFRDAQEQVRDDGFSARVERNLAKPDRRRFFILGGVGSTGAAFSGTQLESLFEQLPQATGLLGQAQSYVGGETLAAAVMAIGVAVVAVMAPKSSVN